MFALTRFRTDDPAALRADAVLLLAALRQRPGFRTGEFGTAADDPGLAALLTTWDGVGSYRRALSWHEVKIAGAPVWVHAVDEPGVFVPGVDV
ncbi:antibiotic biosynthesis monooxygenase [Klenkia sp. PcliD-1-E]|uniref:antibiotic biosynthesis monooxygenase n=1 Tax=Klenkia sp. PcliD-1-E TaxID=2954492 RepID=UPI0020974D40|nr:antibiotic biosynthesis monooxygenase [Klenkia sp. PcliD-1-E]MCO7221698.1 antibiotic biosynthesis monooxygenase [Klenkia sp. PcliD-1-E]